MQDFAGKIALVTGAASGIGQATARALHERGARVMLAVHSEEQAEQMAGEPELAGAQTLAVDVRDPRSVAGMVEATVEAFGGLQLCANCAGITGPAATNIPDYGLEDWNEVLATDLTGMFLCLKYQVPAMLASGGGAIVNMSSANGVVGISGMAAYTVAKHGVVGLTRTAALEFADKSIRVNAVAPGYVGTEKVLAGPDAMLDAFRQAHPMGRLATPEEVAELILFLLSDRSAFATGGVYGLDGGYTAQ